ncbi:hypothetical protein SGRIM128S_00244 [Streptomyces griseomycini]
MTRFGTTSLTASADSGLEGAPFGAPGPTSTMQATIRAPASTRVLLPSNIASPKWIPTASDVCTYEVMGRGVSAAYGVPDPVTPGRADVPDRRSSPGELP